MNTIGAYSGTRPLYGGTYIFDIDSAGPWTISIEPIGAEVTAAATLEGQGDHVSGIFSGAGRGAWEITHSGERNFIAWVHCSDSGSDLVSNEIGAVSGSTVVDADGICFWEIEADGAWSLLAR